MIQQLSKQIGWDGYAVMDEQNVAKYPFHSRLGAVSVRPGDPRSAVETIRYLKQVLRRPRGVVFIFPEGVSRPGALEVGPLQRGVEVIAKAAGVRCVPLAIRYAFLEHEHPDVLIDIGVPHAPGPLSLFTERLTALHAQTMAGAVDRRVHPTARRPKQRAATVGRRARSHRRAGLMGDRTYRIHVAAEMSGVNEGLIRAWERRYGVLNPQRTPSGYRAYTDDDIELLKATQEADRRGPLDFTGRRAAAADSARAARGCRAGARVASGCRAAGSSLPGATTFWRRASGSIRRRSRSCSTRRRRRCRRWCFSKRCSRRCNEWSAIAGTPAP